MPLLVVPITLNVPCITDNNSYDIDCNNYYYYNTCTCTESYEIQQWSLMIFCFNCWVTSLQCDDLLIIDVRKWEVMNCWKTDLGLFSVLTTTQSACCYIENDGVNKKTLEVHFYYIWSDVCQSTMWYQISNWTKNSLQEAIEYI